MISLIDYGAGNIRSISNALKKVGAETEVAEGTIDPGADALVLPGVGNFGDAMRKLDPVRADLLEALESGKPFLGLCLGLQLLFEGSEEAPGAKGLGILKGGCKRFKEGKVPHMGWNQVSASRGPLFRGIEDSADFYFVHSYYAPVVEETVGVCSYGADFSAAVQKGCVYACQFHPERSGPAGLRVLENFVGEVRR